MHFFGNLAYLVKYACLKAWYLPIIIIITWRVFTVEHWSLESRD